MSLAANQWRIAMPTLLPPKMRTRAAAARVLDARAIARDDSHALGAWAILMGVAAFAVAAMAYSTTGDQVGAAGILMAAATVIALLSRSA
jgi:hypothetical protein